MTFEIAPMIIEYFAQDESAGGAPGTLAIFRRVSVRVGDRDADGPMIPVMGIRGNVAPVSDADLEITEAAGRRREGHIHVFTIEPLQVDDESTGETSWFVLHEGFYYFIEEQDAWHYAGGHRYLATRDRRESNV